MIKSQEKVFTHGVMATFMMEISIMILKMDKVE